VLRILIANLLVQVLPLALVAAGLVLLFRRQAGSAVLWRSLGLVLLALPLGLFAYIAVGVAAAGLRGDGHFYSVPFGGYTLSNADVLTSAAMWIAITLGILFLAIRARLDST
jgi:hypothetical protein